MERIKKHANAAKKKLHSFSGWFKKHLAFTIILATVLVLFVGSLIFVTVFYHDKAAPRVTVANINVGGKTHDQVVESIDNLVANFKLSLTFNGKSVTATASDLGIAVDSNKIADEVVATGKANPFAIVFQDHHFSLDSSYDKDKALNFVTEKFPELTSNPVDAQVIYDNNQNRYIVQPGAVGNAIQQDKLFAKIDSLLAEPKLASYEIETIKDEPTVSDQSAQTVADTVNNSLSQTIQITNNGRVLWTLDPWDVASWTTLTINNDTGSYDINYDLEKIKQFISDTVTAQLTNKPVNRKAITDSNGNILKVISEGRNGQTANNIDQVAKGVKAMLTDGRSGQTEMTTSEAAYGTDKTVAKDGRWVEYDISSYTATAYEGTNAVWSTNQTANGKPSTPTITGLYSVWRKTYEQCMPNPPSPDPLCNIHYVTYWERSGYAFHEAWWMGSNVQTGLSHGCINMRINDAKFIYDFTSLGTPVWVHY